MKLKNIKIEENIWWELNKLKVEWKLKTLSEVVTKIVKERKK
jgi:predicted CopG family antitoxin